MTEPTAAQLKQALQDELTYLWDDLSHHHQSAVNGQWSIGCEGVAERIHAVSGLVGPADWENIDIRILMNHLYQDIQDRIGQPVDVPMDRVEATWRATRRGIATTDADRENAMRRIEFSWQPTIESQEGSADDRAEH